jgi:acyl transferase domain-containing protein
LLFHFNF